MIIHVYALPGLSTVDLSGAVFYIFYEQTRTFVTT